MLTYSEDGKIILLALASQNFVQLRPWTIIDGIIVIPATKVTYDYTSINVC